MSVDTPTENVPAGDAPRPPRPGAYLTLDLWRALACLGVVLYHSSAIITARYASLADYPLYRAGAYGYLGVPIFFVISGYCIAGAAVSTLRREAGWKSFTFARVRRIYPPCLYSLALVMLLAAVARVLVERHRLHDSALAAQGIFHRSFLFYFSNLTLTQIVLRQPFLSIVCWTLCYEMAFYLIVALLLALRSRSRTPMTLLTDLHFVTLASLLWMTAWPSWRFYPLDLWPQFGLGVVVYDLATNPENRWARGFAIAFAAVIGIFIIGHEVTIGPQAEPSRITFAVSLGFAALLWGLYRYDARMSENRLVRLLSRVGVFSYSIYLTHFLTLGVVDQAFRRGHGAASTHLLLLAGFFVAAIIVGRVFYQFFERPYMHAKPIERLNHNWFGFLKTVIKSPGDCGRRPAEFRRIGGNPIFLWRRR